MRYIKNYIGLLFCLLCSITGDAQNLVPFGDFESGCNTTGWTTQFVQNCYNYWNWLNIAAGSQYGEYTIDNTITGVEPVYTGATPYHGSYFYIATGPYTNCVGEYSPPRTSNCPPLLPSEMNIFIDTAWQSTVTVYPGNDYLFSAWYYNENWNITNGMGTLSLLVNGNPTTNSSFVPNSNPLLSGWNQMFLVYTPTGSGPVEATISITMGNSIYQNDNYNDFELDYIYFGIPCDASGYASTQYYQNTTNLPDTTEAMAIIAGDAVTTKNADGIVSVTSGQNVTFEAYNYVSLKPGFKAAKGSVFAANAYLQSQIQNCQPVPASCSCYYDGGCRMSAVDLNALRANNTTSENQVQVYPNPTKGIVNIALGGATEQTAAITIYNSLGRQLYASSASFTGTKVVEADLNAEPSGVYIVQVTSGATVTTQKVVLAK